MSSRRIGSSESQGEGLSGSKLPSAVLENFELDGPVDAGVELNSDDRSRDELLGSLLRDGNWLASEPSRQLGGTAKPSLPRIGDEVMGLRLIRELGRGAFARVFLAEQRALADRPVAVKISLAQRHEAQTLAQLQHTHIVPIYSAHSDPCTNLCVLVMPYFGGTTLDRLLSRTGGQVGGQATGRSLVTALDDLSLWPAAPSGAVLASNSQEGGLSQPNPAAGALRLGRPQLGSRLLGRGLLETRSAVAASPRTGQTARTYLERSSYFEAVTWIAARLAEGLAHAHQRGILHRDIKPSNVLIAGDGQPMLLDFNLARDLKTAGPEATAYVGGTLPYMAPEHLDAFDKLNPTPSSAVDERSDIYSLGVVLYEMLTRRRAFPMVKGQRFCSALLQGLARERRQQTPSPRAFDPSIPWSLDSIVRRCLDPEPARRYQEAAHLAEDLQRELDHLPLRHAAEPSLAGRVRKWAQRHPALSSGGSIAVISIVLVISLAYVTLLVGSHLASYDVERRWIKFQEGLIRAQLLTHTGGETGIDLAKAERTCEATLAIFDVLRDANWVRSRRMARLDQPKRRQVLDNATELAILLARIRAEQAERADSAAEQTRLMESAVRLLDQAEQFPAETVPRALYEDRSKYRSLLGDTVGSDSDLGRARAMPLETARDHFLAGTRLAAEKQYTEALPHLQAAIRLAPKHFWAHFQLSICYYQLGQFVRAVDSCNTCEAIWEECAWTNLNRGLAYSRQERWAEAIADFSAAIRKDPQFATAYLNRGLVQLKQHGYAAAVADLSQALELGDKTALVRAARAAALAAQEQWEAAETDFAAALEINPGDQSILLSRGFALVRHDPQRALDDFDCILRQQPNMAQAHYGRAAVLSQLADRSQQALEAARAAVDCNPELVQAQCTFAVLLARTGQSTEAIDRIEQVLKKWESGMALYSAACVYALASRSDAARADQALGLLEQALENNYGRDSFRTDTDLDPIRPDPRFP